MKNPTEDKKDSIRMRRGGGRTSSVWNSRVFLRDYYLPDRGSSVFGFRIVRSKP